MTPRDEPDELADEIRRNLLAAGATPRNLEPRPGQADRGEAFLQAILQLPREEPPNLATEAHPQRKRRIRNIARGGLLVAVAAVVALVLVVAQPRHVTPPLHAATPPLLKIDGADPGTIPASGAPAKQVLERLGELAGQQHPSPDLPVQHLTIAAWWASVGEEPGGDVKGQLESVERDSYFQSDGTMRVIERRGPVLDSKGRVSPPFDSETLTDESFVSEDPGPSYADQLPVDLTALRAKLDKAHDPTVCESASGACLMNDMIDLFHNYVVSPALMSALWSLLAADPTVTYLGQVRDRLDRSADAFTTAGEDGMSQKLLLISPTTGAYLGEEVVLTKRSEAYPFSPPAVISFSALVDSERVPRSALP